MQYSDFETGDLSNWIFWGNPGPTVVTDNVHSGTYAVHIIGGGAPEQTTTYDFELAYKANKDREVTLQLKSDNNQVVAEKTYKILAGYGMKNFQ